MEKNLETYNSESVVKWYFHLNEITAVEKIVFEKHKPLLFEAKLLDIGIGGGRTTDFLKNKCRSYTGIDYSTKFVASAKSKFPGENLLVMDARDLGNFKDGSFDFVNFSFNGMDYVDLEGRKKIVSEISRVLKKGGVFFFSTHNKDHTSFNIAPWKNKDNSFLTNLKTFIKLLPFIPRKIRAKKNQLITSEYAIINDSAHNYNLTTFYTSVNFLKQQLSHHAFTEIVFYDKKGETVKEEKLEDWIFVTAIKA